MKPLNYADLDTAARTVFGEARGEPESGQRAVVHVIINRAKKHDWSLTEVCRQPRQFSCWNTMDPNRQKLLALTTDALVPFLLPVLLALHEADTTQGATHYHEKSLLPGWAVGHTPCVTIGRHAFYNDVA